MAPTGINRPGYSSPKSPTGINRPGYSSPKTPTNVNRPGTSSPNFSGYSTPNFSPPSGGSGGVSNFPPGGGGSGSPNTNILQNVLGNYYQKALALGYKPSDLMNQFQKAGSFGRGLNVDRFKEKIDLVSQPGAKAFVGPDGIVRYQVGSNSYMLPEMTANAPRGIGEFFGDIAGGAANLFGAIPKAGGQLFSALKQISPYNMIFGGQKPGEYFEQFIGTPEQRQMQKEQIMALSGADRRRFNELMPSMGAEAALARIAYENRFLNPSFARGGIATLN